MRGVFGLDAVCMREPSTHHLLSHGFLPGPVLYTYAPGCTISFGGCAQLQAKIRVVAICEQAAVRSVGTSRAGLTILFEGSEEHWNLDGVT